MEEVVRVREQSTKERSWIAGSVCLIGLRDEIGWDEKMRNPQQYRAHSPRQ